MHARKMAARLQEATACGATQPDPVAPGVAAPATARASRSPARPTSWPTCSPSCGGSWAAERRRDRAVPPTLGPAVEAAVPSRPWVGWAAMPSQPSKDLVVVDNPHPGRDYEVEFASPELTCICPMTGQPDFATVTITFVPDQHLVELKSLKLYLWTFRDVGRVPRGHHQPHPRRPGGRHRPAAHDRAHPLERAGRHHRPGHRQPSLTTRAARLRWRRARGAAPPSAP